MEKKTGIMLSIIFFLSGIVIGFLLSPIKEGIGNNCGNTTTNNYYGKDQK